MQDSDIKEKIFALIAARVPDKSLQVADDTPLIGDGSKLDSMKIVELCLALEDLSDELGFAFDWTSDAAMSKSRGMFRNAGALAAEFLSQQAAQK